MMQRIPFSSSVLLITVFFAALSQPITTHANAPQCKSVFSENPAPKAIAHYMDQVKAEQNAETIPRYLDPNQELETAKLWRGTREVPRAIKDTLLDSTALINFQLLAADDGVVKLAGPGTFTSFRFNHEWKGKNMGTNVGLPIDAIIARTDQGSNFLVPENAEAVFVFMHGGGTKTTGHHVAASLSNFLVQYGIVVIGIDAPHHAYGPRNTDLTPMEYYEYLRDFRHEFIPEGVPTFIGGHSMGGLHADNLMRLSDQPELGIKQAFAGLINLSGPLDSAPGESIAGKDAVDKKLNEDPAIIAKIPMEEQNLNVQLLTQGKVSATSGISTSLFSGIVNWRFPEHRGDEYLPTLVVMGERDALYLGREHTFQEYLDDLTNTETEILKERQNFKGRTVRVAHMIFDHYRPGTEDMESFYLMKEFIQRQIGSTTSSTSQILLRDMKSADLGLVTRITQEYYQNLAFRKFADQYELLVKKGTAEVGKLGQSTGLLTKEKKLLHKQITSLEKSKEDPQTLAALRDRVQELEIQIGANTDRLNSSHIPEGELADFAAGNIKRRQRLKRYMLNNSDSKKQKLEEFAQVHDRKVAQEKQLERALEALIDNALESGENPFFGDVKPAYESYSKALDTMIKWQDEMDSRVAQMVQNQVGQNDFRVNPDLDTLQVFSDLDKAYEQYNATLTALQSAIEQAVWLGQIKEAGILDPLTELWGNKNAYKKGNAHPDSLIGRIERLSEEVEAFDEANSYMQVELNRLLEDYINQVTPGLYELSTTTMASELDQPLGDFLKNSAQAQKLWKDWRSIWKERPPDQTTSLY